MRLKLVSFVKILLLHEIHVFVRLILEHLEIDSVLVVQFFNIGDAELFEVDLCHFAHRIVRRRIQRIRFMTPARFEEVLHAGLIHDEQLIVEHCLHFGDHVVIDRARSAEYIERYPMIVRFEY